MSKTREVTERGSAAGDAERDCTAAALEVIESMFFEVPVETPEMRDLAPEGAVAARALFGGDLSGSFLLACQAWTARRLAASFLGRDDEATVETDQVNLVVCELANMVCGNALSRMEPHGRFQIGTPEILQQCGDERGWLTFTLESGALAVRLRIEDYE